jgi:hypothetical protein
MILSSRQGILKGEVSLYHWPPVWLVWNPLYDYWQFIFLFAKQTNPKPVKQEVHGTMILPVYYSLLKGSNPAAAGTSRKSFILPHILFASLDQPKPFSFFNIIQSREKCDGHTNNWDPKNLLLVFIIAHSVKKNIFKDTEFTYDCKTSFILSLLCKEFESKRIISFFKFHSGKNKDFKSTKFIYDYKISLMLGLRKEIKSNRVINLSS